VNEDDLTEALRAAASTAGEEPAPATWQAIQSRAARRRHARIAAVTALSVALVVVVGVLAVQDPSSTRVRVVPADETTVPTSPATTTVGDGCAAVGGFAAASGSADLTAAGITHLSNVQIQASDCLDEIAFLFEDGAPEWSVEYVEGPFSEDPSDRPVDVPGVAFLRVTFRQASGFRSTEQGAKPVYDGPSAMRPPAPSGLSSVVRLGDFEAVTTWVIGLPDRRPFEVVRRTRHLPGGEPYREQVVVRVAPARPRDGTCSLAGSPLDVVNPAGWFVEMSDRWPCRYFDPAPFMIFPATDALSWRVTAAVAEVPADAYLEQLRGGDDELVVTDTTVAGLRARRVDIVSGDMGLGPAGQLSRMYIVDTGERATILRGGLAYPGPDQDAVNASNLAALEDLVRLVRQR
jgi:hypothetical protein